MIMTIGLGSLIPSLILFLVGILAAPLILTPLCATLALAGESILSLVGNPRERIQRIGCPPVSSSPIKILLRWFLLRGRGIVSKLYR
jgi:hypothetical protein